MEILVINNTNKKDIEIETWIDELFEKYMEICEIRILYQVSLAEKSLKDRVNEINENSEDLINSFERYVCNNPKDKEFLKYRDTLDYSDLKILILMDSARISNKWGEANEYIDVIKHISKSNLWHEISHHFKVDDYYINSEIKKEFCDNKDCLMGYGQETEIFCEYAKEEIRRYFLKDKEC